MKVYAILLIFTVIACPFIGCSKEKKMSSNQDADKSDVSDLTKKQKKIIELVISDYNKDSDISNRKVIFDLSNSLWQKKLENLGDERTIIRELEDKLNAYKYQAVKLELLPEYLGGDVWYFVDVDSYKIITYYGEK